MIHVHTFTEAGGHATNEDAFVANPIPGDRDGRIVCLADGQGGRAGGAKAARLACDTAVSLSTAPGDWAGILSRADRAVAADPDAGFTTLIGFAVWGDTVVGASCGDSAVLAISGDGTVTELTRLQSKNPPVGSGEATFIPFEAELTRPWKILAMTDGVWKYVGWERIRALAKSLGSEELIAALQAAARLPGSGQFQDDFTVVLLEAGVTMYRITRVLSVGPFASPERAESLRAAGVTHVLNVSTGASQIKASEGGFREVAWVPLDDFERMPHAVATEVLDTLHRMASEPDSHVYVHCVAGHLRSPTVMWLYLIALGVPPDDARDWIEDRSRDANPGHRKMVDHEHVALAQKHGLANFLPLARPEVIVPVPLEAR